MAEGQSVGPRSALDAPGPVETLRSPQGGRHHRRSRDHRKPVKRAVATARHHPNKGAAVTTLLMIFGTLAMSAFIGLCWRIGQRPYLVEVHLRVDAERQGSPFPTAQSVRAAHERSRAPEIPSALPSTRPEPYGLPLGPRGASEHARHLDGPTDWPTATLDSSRPALEGAVMSGRGQSGRRVNGTGPHARD